MGVEQVELFTKTIRVTSIDMESYAMIHQLLLSKVLENELQGKFKKSKGRFLKLNLTKLHVLFGIIIIWAYKMFRHLAPFSVGLSMPGKISERPQEHPTRKCFLLMYSKY